MTPMVASICAVTTTKPVKTTTAHMGAARVIESSGKGAATNVAAPAMTAAAAAHIDQRVAVQARLTRVGDRRSRVTNRQRCRLKRS
jgi:hypothetical protein